MKSRDGTLLWLNIKPNNRFIKNYNEREEENKSGKNRVNFTGAKWTLAFDNFFVDGPRASTTRLVLLDHLQPG